MTDRNPDNLRPRNADLDALALLRDWRSWWPTEFSDDLTLTGKQANELCELLVDAPASPSRATANAGGAGFSKTGRILSLIPVEHGNAFLKFVATGELEPAFEQLLDGGSDASVDARRAVDLTIEMQVDALQELGRNLKRPDFIEEKQ